MFVDFLVISIICFTCIIRFMLWIVICVMSVCFVALSSKSTAMVMAGRTVTSESMCTKYRLTAFSSLPWKKCGKVNPPVDLGRKATKQTNRTNISLITIHNINLIYVFL